MSERKVIVYEYQKVKGQSYMEKVPVGNGIFHQFGVDYEEFESGPGNYGISHKKAPSMASARG